MPPQRPLKPYYEHAGITIYNGFVVNCDTWTRTRELEGTGRGSAGKMSPFFNLGLSLALSSPKITSVKESNGAKSTTLGWGPKCQIKAAEAERCGDIATLAPAGAAAQKSQNAIILMAIRLITQFPILRCFAGDVTWKATVA